MRHPARRPRRPRSANTPTRCSRRWDTHGTKSPLSDSKACLHEAPMTAASILSSVDNGIGRIVLNRPEKRNALTEVMIAAVLDALDRFSRDDDVRVVVLSAAGGSFCAGVDLADMQTVREQRGSFDYGLLPELFER